MIIHKTRAFNINISSNVLTGTIEIVIYVYYSTLKRDVLGSIWAQTNASLESVLYVIYKWKGCPNRNLRPESCGFCGNDMYVLNR